MEERIMVAVSPDNSTQNPLEHVHIENVQILTKVFAVFFALHLGLFMTQFIFWVFPIDIFVLKLYLVIGETIIGYGIGLKLAKALMRKIFSDLKIP